MDLNSAQWKKSSYSGNNGGQCVEVASNLPAVVAVRDSKNPEGGTLVLPREFWAEFLAAARSGVLDL